MVSFDLDALRPPAAEVELVAGLLVELGPAMAAELAADLGLPRATVGGAFAYRPSARVRVTRRKVAGPTIIRRSGR